MRMWSSGIMMVSFCWHCFVGVGLWMVQTALGGFLFRGMTTSIDSWDNIRCARLFPPLSIKIIWSIVRGGGKGEISFKRGAWPSAVVLIRFVQRKAQSSGFFRGKPVWNGEFAVLRWRYITVSLLIIVYLETRGISRFNRASTVCLLDKRASVGPVLDKNWFTLIQRGGGESE